MYLTPAEIEILIDEIGVKLDDYKDNGMDDEYIEKLEKIHAKLEKLLTTASQ